MTIYCRWSCIEVHGPYRDGCDRETFAVSRHDYESDRAGRVSPVSSEYRHYTGNRRHAESLAKECGEREGLPVVKNPCRSIINTVHVAAIAALLIG